MYFNIAYLEMGSFDGLEVQLYRETHLMVRETPSKYPEGLIRPWPYLFHQNVGTATGREVCLLDFWGARGAILSEKEARKLMRRGQDDQDDDTSDPTVVRKLLGAQ
jgi:hypothetical protein